MPGKVPDRWGEYTPYKSPVKGTRFIAFKVPLEQGICQRLPKEQWFTPTDLIDSLEKDDFKLGLVIDLTNTKRYYKPAEIESRGVGYIKINTEGRVVPSKTVQDKFAGIIDDFLERNSDNELLIGIHCTHGLNRTGYMVCRYMIDKMKFIPKEAVDAFNEGRGYCIERENYIADLLNSNRDPEDKLPVDKVSDGEIVEDEDSESGVASFPPKPTDQDAVIGGADDDKLESSLGTGRGGFVPRGNFRGRFQDDFRGRGNQRRPFYNRGHQNNYNRGGGFNQNFDNRGGYANRGRGNFRGNFRGGWQNQGYQSNYDYDDDLDEDTEVIITETERGTIIREERSISEHRRKIAEESVIGRGGFKKDEGRSYQKRGFEEDEGRSFRDRDDSRGYNKDWDDRPPSKKPWGDEEYSGSWKGRGRHEDRGRGRGRGSYEDEGRGRGPMPYDKEIHPSGRNRYEDDLGPYENEGRKSYDGEGFGRNRGRYESEGHGRGRGSNDNGRGRVPFDEGHRKGRGSYDDSRGRGKYEGRGRGKRSYDEGHGRGRGSYDGERRTFHQKDDDWEYGDKGYQESGPSKKFKYRDEQEDKEYPKRMKRDYSSTGQNRRSWSPDEPPSYRSKDSGYRGRGQYEGFRGRGDGYGRGRGETEGREGYGRGRGDTESRGGYGRGRGNTEGRGGYGGRGRGRERSPSFLDGGESPTEYQPKERAPSYSEDGPGPVYRGRGGPPDRFKERGGPSHFREREDSPPSTPFRKKLPSAFRDSSPPPTFRQKVIPAQYRDISPDFDMDEGHFKKRPHYEEGFSRGRGNSRGQMPRGRGGSFKSRDSFHDDDSDDSPPAAPRRRMTPPAQYRDPSPGFKGCEDSPPFREDSPPFRGSDDGFRSRDYRGRNEGFRGHGRGDGPGFRGRGFQRGGF